MTNKTPSTCIMVLANKHLNRHPNDKSFRHLATMRRMFGPLRTTQTLKKTIETYGLVFPELLLMLKAHDDGLPYGDIRNINIDRIMLAEGFYQHGPEKSWVNHQNRNSGSFHSKPHSSGRRANRIFYDDISF